MDFVTNITDGTRVYVRTSPNAQQIQDTLYFDSFNTLSSKQRLQQALKPYDQEESV